MVQCTLFTCKSIRPSLHKYESRRHRRGILWAPLLWAWLRKPPTYLIQNTSLDYFTTWSKSSAHSEGQARIRRWGQKRSTLARWFLNTTSETRHGNWNHSPLRAVPLACTIVECCGMNVCPYNYDNNAIYLPPKGRSNCDRRCKKSNYVNSPPASISPQNNQGWRHHSKEMTLIIWHHYD